MKCRRRDRARPAAPAIFPRMHPVDLAALAARLPARPLTRFAPSPTGYLHLGHVANAVWVWGMARALGRAGAAPARGPRPGPLPAGVRGRAARRPRVAGTRAGRRRAGRVPRRARRRSARATRRASTGRARAAAAPAGLRLRLLRGRTSPAPRATSSTRRPGIRGAAATAGSTAGARPRAPAPAGPGRRALRRRPARRAGAGSRRRSAATCCCATGWGSGPTSSPWWWTTSGTGWTWSSGARTCSSSTGRQIRLGRLLGRPAPPVFLHHPLIRKPGGEKLSKSSGDTGIRELRAAGVDAGGGAGAGGAGSPGSRPSPTPLGRDDLAKLFAAG